MKNKRNQKGIVLIYALIILMVVTAIGLGISFLIVREIQLTSHSHFASQAFYAAESGIERGLYTVKANRVLSQTLATTLTAIQGYQGNSPVFNNGANYNDIGTNSSAVNTLSKLAQNSIWQLDLYKVDDPNTAINIQRIEIVGGGNGSEWLEFSSTEYKSGEPQPVPVKKSYFGHTELLNTAVVSLGGNYVGYRMRLRALFADIDNIEVHAYDSTGLIDDYFCSQIILSSTGSKSDFQQAITASLPWKMPLSALYDYVLFSETEISKTKVIGKKIYTSGPVQIEANIPSTLRCSGDCSVCQGNPYNWSAISCEYQPPIYKSAYCAGSENGNMSSCPAPGTCTIVTDNAAFGFTLPIPDAVPPGDEYYVSLRMWYWCKDGSIGPPVVLPDGQCDNLPTSRNIAVEINGNSTVINDQALNLTKVWRTCTIPTSFSLGDPVLPANDPSRTVKFSVYPLGWTWHVADRIDIDWYQLSTYKIFEDCQ